MNACAYPENCVRGGPSLTTFFFLGGGGVGEGVGVAEWREDLNAT